MASSTVGSWTRAIFRSFGKNLNAWNRRLLVNCHSLSRQVSLDRRLWIDWVWLFAKTCILIYAFAFMIYELNQISRTKNGPNSKLNWMLLFLFWNPRQTTAGPWDSGLGSVNTDQLLTVTERIWLGISGSNVDGRNEVVEQIILCSVHQICIRAKLTTGGVKWREILLG